MVTAADNPAPSPAAAPFDSTPPVACCPLPIASPLPPLSPPHARLLNSFFNLRGDLVSLAESEKLSAADLLAWSSDPAVQQHIAALYDLHQAALALAASRAKRTALDTLEGLAKTSEDPIERRRAAAAIIRPGSTRDITRPFAQDDIDDADPDDDQDLDEDPGDSDSSDLSDNTPNAFDPPNPPPPFSDPVPIAEGVDALKKPRDRAVTCRLYNYFLPDATACGLPIPKNPSDYGIHFAALFGHADTLLHEQRHFCTADHLAPNDRAYRLTFKSQDGRPFEFHIELTRPDDGDFPKCWLIKSLNWTDRLEHVDPKRRAKAREAAKAAPDSS